MTEWNFARSSARAAANIVLTVSTTCVSSEVSGFCCALAAKTFAEKIRAKITANLIGNRDDMEEASLRANRNERAHNGPRDPPCTGPLEFTQSIMTNRRDFDKTECIFAIDFFDNGSLAAVAGIFWHGRRVFRR